VNRWLDKEQEEDQLTCWTEHVLAIEDDEEEEVMR
jgi:hypothetical protein